MPFAPCPIRLAATVAVVLVHTAHAQFTFVSTRADLHANASLDWAALGSAGTTVSQPFDLWTTGVSRKVTVSQSTSGSFTRLDQDSAATHLPWDGNFLPGEALLYTAGTAGPVTLTFNSPVQAVGLQFQKADQGNPDFLARIEAFDASGTSLGSFNRAGSSDTAADGSALFLGVQSDLRNIARIQVNEVWGKDFAVNQVSIQVPEPAAGATLGLLGCFGFVLARKAQSNGGGARAGTNGRKGATSSRTRSTT